MTIRMAKHCLCPDFSPLRHFQHSWLPPVTALTCLYCHMKLDCVLLLTLLFKGKVSIVVH